MVIDMKRKVLRKMLAAMLTATMVVMNLTACGNDTPDSGSSAESDSKPTESTGNQESTGSQESAEGESEEKEPKEIRTLTIWSGDAHSKNVMLELIDNFNKTQGKELGVEIEYSVKSDITKDIEAAVASKQEPDMYKAWASTAAKLYETGEIVSLEDIEGGPEYLATYPEGEINRVRDKTTGKVEWVPYYVNTFGVAINKDLFVKRGLVDEKGEVKAPKTYEEFRECAKALTNTEDGEYGIVFPLGYSSFWQVLPRVAFPSTGTFGYDVKTGVYDYEKLEAVYRFALDIKHDGSIYPGADGLDNDAARALFAEGKIGMIFTGSYDTAVFTSQFPAKCDWMVIPYPTETEDAPYKQLSSSNDGLVMNVEMVEKLGAETALEVYKWYHGTEVLTALYRTGCCIPWDTSIIDNTTVDSSVHSTWTQYAQLNAFSVPQPTKIPTDLEGTPDIGPIFSTKIWAEDGDLTEVLTDLSKRSNEGIEKSFAANPNLVKERYIDKDLDIDR